MALTIMPKNFILRLMDVRVVITGMGAVTPLGNDMKATWTALKSGASGVNRITKFDAAAFPCRYRRGGQGLRPPQVHEHRGSP